jgi:hypothetical protein
MPGGFAPRFAIEAGFLILLGVGAGIADLRPVVIVALLAGGWVLVSLIELSVWRAEARTNVPRRLPAPVEQPKPVEPAEPEREIGWPLEEQEEPAEEPYPLRRDANVVDAEAAEYTRVTARERGSPDDTG